MPTPDRMKRQYRRWPACGIVPFTAMPGSVTSSRLRSVVSSCSTWSAVRRAAGMGPRLNSTKYTSFGWISAVRYVGTRLTRDVCGTD